MPLPLKTVKIVVMGRYFLYMPLYVALSEELSNPIYDKSQGEGYDLKLTVAKPQSDLQACSVLMDTMTKEYDDIWFAIGDPTALLDDRLPSTQNSRPVVLSSLVVNAAFWAVNHTDNQIKNVRDIAEKFDTIIACGEGTTSYAIASQIMSLKSQQSPSQHIEVVEPFQELIKLAEIQGAQASKVIALSPELLEIEELVSSIENSYTINLALGSTPEYNDIVVTALMTRSDIVDKHEHLVVTIVNAIQKALLLIHLEQPSILQTAEDYFPARDNFSLGRALRKAEEAAVFPWITALGRANWINTCKRVYCEGEQFRPDLKEKAESFYDVSIEPYKKYADRAAKTFFGSLLTKNSIKVEDKTKFRNKELSRNISLATIGFTIGILFSRVALAIKKVFPSLTLSDELLLSLSLIGFLSIQALVYRVWELQTSRIAHTFHIFISLLVVIGIFAVYMFELPASNIFIFLGVLITIDFTLISTKF